MSVTFISTVRAMTAKATTLTVPAEAVAALGHGKRPPVVITLNAHTYRARVGIMNGDFLVPFSENDRKAAGVAAGDQVEVTMQLDEEPRILEVPEELAAALAQVEGATAAFDALAPSKRKEFARQVSEAKTQATRERRIANILATLKDS
jgi:hypothetical protein